MHRRSPDHEMAAAATPTMGAARSGLALASGVLLAIVVAGTFAIWPVTTGLMLTVAAVSWLATRAPSVAFVVVLVAFGAEGSIKLLLAGEPTPVPISPDALGAGALDAVLFVALIALMIDDRGATLHELWAAASRAERATIALVGLWLAASVLQIFQSGAPARGVAGFRLTQAYVAVALGGAIAFSPRRDSQKLVRVLLIALGAIGFYAAFRALLGPTQSERSYALAKLTVAEYGPTFRTVGSFSGSVGMDSYLAPGAVFAATLALLSRRYAALGLSVVALASIAIVTSYGRMPLVAVTIGLLCAAALSLGSSRLTRRRKLLVVVGVSAVLGIGAAGVILASNSSPQVHARLRAFVDPAGDQSLRQRVHTWNVDLREIADHPLGRGLGTVGASSGTTRSGSVNTADNSFLKVLVEQGIPVGAVFLGGLFGLCVLIGIRLKRLNGDRRTLGVAAFSAFITFLALFPAGEYIEQPGKVVAWTLLGAAIAQAWGATSPDALA